MSKQRRFFTAEFKREAASLVLDQGYSHADACRSLDIGETALRRWVDQLRAERKGITPQSKAMTPEQQKIQLLEAQINRHEREKAILKGYRALDVGKDRSCTLVDQLVDPEPVEMVCDLLDLSRSTYYEHRQRARRFDPVRVLLRSRVNELFAESRSSAGSRTIVGILRDNGIEAGRFKVRGSMRELGLISKQPGSHGDKNAMVGRLDIPNTLNRAFDMAACNQVWCGDITYIWARGQWHSLVVVMDLYACRVVGWAFSPHPDAALVIRALDMACE